MSSTTVLLTLFVVALAVTIIGFLLSFKPHLSKPRLSGDRTFPQREGRTQMGRTARGSYRRGLRAYDETEIVPQPTKRASRYAQPAAVTHAASVEAPALERYTRRARLKGPAADITYDLYREESTASRMWSHFNLMRLFRPQEGQPVPWLGVVLVSVVLFSLGMSVLQPVLNRTAVGSFFIPAESAPTATAVAKSTSAAKTAAQSSFASAKAVTSLLVRINQLDPAQYASTSEYNTWADSTCSSASMAEVINAYSGKHYRVTDILKVEVQLKQITPELGLLQNSGIGLTVAKFGFASTYLNSTSLDTIVKIANQGHPVIVNFPPSRWPGGHLLVLRGGQGDNVSLTDSSTLNMQTMARSKFLQYWGGSGIVVYPK